MRQRIKKETFLYQIKYLVDGFDAMSIKFLQKVKDESQDKPQDTI